MEPLLLTGKEKKCFELLSFLFARQARQVGENVLIYLPWRNSSAPRCINGASLNCPPPRLAGVPPARTGPRPAGHTLRFFPSLPRSVESVCQFCSMTQVGKKGRMSGGEQGEEAEDSGPEHQPGVPRAQMMFCGTDSFCSLPVSTSAAHKS